MDMEVSPSGRRTIVGLVIRTRVQHVRPISSSSLSSRSFVVSYLTNILFCIRIICSLGLLRLRSLRGVYSPIRRPWHFLKKHAYMHLHCLSLVNYRDQGTVLKFNLVPFWKEVSCCAQANKYLKNPNVVSFELALATGGGLQY